jgi:hypothetical protein
VDEQPNLADPTARDAVPVCREIPGEHLANAIGPGGTLSVDFNGLKIPVALPPLASAILQLIDGTRSVGDIAATLAGRGVGHKAFDQAWRQTFAALERINRVLLAAPVAWTPG